MNKILIAFSLLFFASSAYAQQYSLRGEIKDSDGQPLPSASVFLLTKSDSTLTQFVTTNTDGTYEFKSVPKGEHIIQCSFVGFKTYYENVSADGDVKQITVRTINMKDNSELEELTVEAEVIPIIIKNDTVEYNAAAFKVKENDMTEDLLKKLPGVEVDKDGNIKAQGENVDKVLVNGKEFFGDDPKMATKNLPAGTVKKVQVYNRQSDQSELSGIDDGETAKTINIELKDEAKIGAFGNVMAGYGYNDTGNASDFDRYELKANISKFTDKAQIAFLGQLNNVNKQGFSFDDYVGFIGGFSNFDGNMWEMNGADLSVPVSFSGTSGLSETAAGGLNLNYDFKKGTRLISSYFYSIYENELTQDVFTENFFDEGSFTSGSNTKRKTIFGAHNANLRFDHKIDTTHNFRFRGNFKYNEGNIESLSTSYTNNTSNLIQNESETNYNSVSDNLSYNGNLLYSYRFKKVGRVTTINGSLSSSDNNRPLDLFSINTFYNYNPNFSYDFELNQDQSQIQKSLNYDGKVTHTEPIGKKRFIEGSFAHRNNNYESINEFIDVQPNGELVPNTMLSNNYTNDYVYDRLGLSFRQVRTKYNLTLGVDGQQSSLNGLVNDTLPVTVEFQNILPRANLRYNITSSKNLMMRYRTSVDEPSITQLQPVRNNTNPLNLYLGNDSLTAAYTHSMYIHYLSFSQFSGTNFYANLNARYTKNRITNSTEIDSLTYVRISKPVNVDYDLNISSYISFGAPLKFMKAKFNVSTNNGYTNSIVFVNNKQDFVDRYNVGVDFSIENSKKDLVDIMFGVEFSQTISKYQLNSNFDQKFFTTVYFTSIDVDLEKWTFNTTFDYNVYSGDAFADDQVIPLLHAYVSRFFMPANRLEMRLSAFDIFNQNIGFSRYADLNYIQQESTNNLARYFMFSLFYKLNKMENPNASGGKMRWGRRR
ncbi:MAG: outer membrane beta-barrel protein [Bacteroidia bacterium]